MENINYEVFLGTSEELKQNLYSHGEDREEIQPQQAGTAPRTALDLYMGWFCSALLLLLLDLFATSDKFSETVNNKNQARGKRVALGFFFTKIGAYILGLK